MNYRPITDTWILARPKVKYYGAYPSGFLERARSLLGVSIFDPVLHVCGGRVRDYPFRGFGPNDRTVDLDPELKPDYLMDVRQLGGDGFGATASDLTPNPLVPGMTNGRVAAADLWPAALADPPYSEEEAKNYKHASSAYPDPVDLLRRCLSVVRPGGRVGWLDFVSPRPPKKDVRLVAVITVFMGYNNAARLFTVYEREEPKLAKRQRKRALDAVRGKVASS